MNVLFKDFSITATTLDSINDILQLVDYGIIQKRLETTYGSMIEINLEPTISTKYVYPLQSSSEVLFTPYEFSQNMLRLLDTTQEGNIFFKNTNCFLFANYFCIISKA